MIGVEQFSPVICTLTYVVCVPPYLSLYCTEVLVLYVHVCILTLSMCCGCTVCNVCTVCIVQCVEKMTIITFVG